MAPHIHPAGIMGGTADIMVDMAAGTTNVAAGGANGMAAAGVASGNGSNGGISCRHCHTMPSVSGQLSTSVQDPLTFFRFNCAVCVPFLLTAVTVQ
ncbi:hypothetical protein AA101099_0784 [Neoasaia chiangmaiensis NBRC 101099]|nr:hypothetical protein AA101099_0784 [Neoasaia chiangmaiensis NBRC 101099]GEN15019.1 hypothetical protein NCH01_14500 [Neoasaia chiangmaiensis]